MLLQLPPSELLPDWSSSLRLALEFSHRNAANFLSLTNLLMGLSSILCNLNGQPITHYNLHQPLAADGRRRAAAREDPAEPLRYGQWACWLLLIGFMLDLADGAVARQLNVCSALGDPTAANRVPRHRQVTFSRLFRRPPLSLLGQLQDRQSYSRLETAAPGVTEFGRDIGGGAAGGCQLSGGGRHRGAKLDDFADFTSFGLASALLLRPDSTLDALLVMVYVLAVFTRLCFYTTGVPFVYRGLPCPYASATLSCSSLLSAGHPLVLRAIAVVMILLMMDQGNYPHDKILESQPWKKMVFAGGVFMMLCAFSPLACLYHLVWSISYILFPEKLWSLGV